MVTGLMKNNLTQKLATGAAALGVLAGVGLASAPAQAALMIQVTDSAGNVIPGKESATLQELLDGSMIGVWHTQDPFHLWFKDFENYVATCTGLNCNEADPSRITVTPTKSPDPLSGIRLVYSSASEFFANPGQTQDTTFDYSVWAHHDGKPISDIHLSLGGHSVPDGGFIKISEDVTDIDDPTRPIEDLFVCDDKTINPCLQLEDGHDINPPVRHLRVSKDIALLGGNTEQTFLSDFHQDFTKKAVPEPSSVLGLLAVGGLGLGMLRKKQG